MKIGIDLDDTLSYTIPGVIDFKNNNYGTNFTLENYTGEHWKVGCKTQDEISKRLCEFHTSQYGKNIKPISNAKEVLEKLKTNNELIIITARPSNTEEETKKWISKYYPNIFSQIYFASDYVKSEGCPTKKDICDEIGIDILIEDNLKYALECVTPNRKVYLINYQWNQSATLPPNVERVNSWKEINIE